MKDAKVIKIHEIYEVWEENDEVPVSAFVHSEAREQLLEVFFDKIKRYIVVANNEIRTIPANRIFAVGKSVKYVPFKIKFPKMQRVLTANDIIQIQPMTRPTGSIFYLDYTYKSKNESK